MRNIGNNLKDSLNRNAINLIKCYDIELRDNKKLFFTNNQIDITYNNVVYTSSNGVDIRTIYNNINLEIDETNISGFIDSDIISEKDIITGKFDNASIEIFLLDMDTKEKISIFCGFIFSISYENNMFLAKVKDKKMLLEKAFSESYSPLCRCSFCDLKCNLNKKDYTIIGVVSKVINQFEFYTSTQDIISKSSDYFSNGSIKIINGKNKDMITEIKKSDGEQLILKFKFPFEINIGDKFELTVGCDKEFNTCISKFNNAINFRGEPNLPRSKKLFKIY